MKRVFAGGTALLLMALAACGGGGGGPSALPNSQSPAQAKGTIRVRITIPGSAAAGKPAALRHALSVAASTSGIAFTVYAHGGSPSTPLATNGADISASSSLCTASGTGRTCIIPISSPAGTVDILAQTYDQSIPQSGAIPAGAHLLAAGVAAAVSVTAGASASVNLTANPVLASVSLASTPNAVRSLLPATISIAVYGFDAGGNLILAGSYVDANGNPVSVTLSTTAPNGSASLNATSFSGSGSSARLTYNGAANRSGTFFVRRIAIAVRHKAGDMVCTAMSGTMQHALALLSS